MLLINKIYFRDIIIKQKKLLIFVYIFIIKYNILFYLYFENKNCKTY